MPLWLWTVSKKELRRLLYGPQYALMNGRTHGSVQWNTTARRSDSEVGLHDRTRKGLECVGSKRVKALHFVGVIEWEARWTCGCEGAGVGAGYGCTSTVLEYSGRMRGLGSGKAGGRWRNAGANECGGLAVERGSHEERARVRRGGGARLGLRPKRRICVRQAMTKAMRVLHCISNRTMGSRQGWIGRYLLSVKTIESTMDHDRGGFNTSRLQNKRSSVFGRSFVRRRLRGAVEKVISQSRQDFLFGNKYSRERREGRDVCAVSDRMAVTNQDVASDVAQKARCAVDVDEEGRRKKEKGRRRSQCGAHADLDADDATRVARPNMHSRSRGAQRLLGVFLSLLLAQRASARNFQLYRSGRDWKGSLPKLLPAPTRLQAVP
ncbi:hypothetical protein DFH09DRAFT_1455324 [Mycena vulgaris]|nr:hypothetical protein DFH09DRAFT_1455324 [Mycena vulgaris]